MFQLSAEEFEHWKSQIVTSNPAAKMGVRRRPYASTEQDAAMLSSVLRSDGAVAVNGGCQAPTDRIPRQGGVGRMKPYLVEFVQQPVEKVKLS